MDTGRPEEVTVIVHRGRELQGKKKGRGKFNVVFSVGNNKFKSEISEDPSGNPEWNNEAVIGVENPQDPLILKVKEKDDIIGQVVIPLAELPARRTDKQRCMSLQPHKKCPNPQGELVFTAWISRKGAPVDATADADVVKKKHRGLAPHDATLKQQSLTLQAGGNLTGSRTSLASTESASTEKKKSMMKKLKGALSHSPLASRKMGAKSSSMMNLGPQTLSVANTDVELRASNESLNSQESHDSVKKKRSTIEKLKDKIGKSPSLGRKNVKSNSKSLSNLAVLNPDMKLSDTHGSNESLKSSKSNKSGGKMKSLFSKGSKKSKSDKGEFPEEFDLSKPTNPDMFLVPETEQYGAVPFNENQKSSPITMSSNKPPKAPTSSVESSPSHSHLSVDDDNPFKRRNNSIQSRRRPDLTKSPAMMRPSPPIPSPNLRRTPSDAKDSEGVEPPKPKNVFAINSDINSANDLWADMKPASPKPNKNTKVQEKTINEAKNPFDEVTDKNPFTTSENPESSNPFESEQPASNPFLEPEKPASNPFSEPERKSSHHTPESEKPMQTHAPSIPPHLENPTPRTLKKLSAPFVFSASDDEDDEKHLPDISGISPREGSTDGGTRVIIRGDYLGKSKSDIVTLTICGVDCLKSLEFFSEYKICCTTGPRKPGSGKIVLETKSGGLARSTLDFIFVQPRPPPSDVPAIKISNTSVTKEKEVATIAGTVRATESDTKTAVVEPMSRNKAVKEEPKETVQIDTPSKRQAPNPPQTTNGTRLQISRKDDIESGDYEKEELLRIITTLQMENKRLKEDNMAMKNYIDGLVIRVLNMCPEALCKDISV